MLPSYPVSVKSLIYAPYRAATDIGDCSAALNGTRVSDVTEYVVMMNLRTSAF